MKLPQINRPDLSAWRARIPPILRTQRTAIWAAIILVIGIAGMVQGFSLYELVKVGKEKERWTTQKAVHAGLHADIDRLQEERRRAVEDQHEQWETQKAVQADLVTEIDKLQEKRRRAVEDLERLKASILTSTPRLAGLQTQLDQARDDHASLASSNEQLALDARALQTEVKTLNAANVAAREAQLQLTRDVAQLTGQKDELTTELDQARSGLEATRFKVEEAEAKYFKLVAESEALALAIQKSRAQWFAEKNEAEDAAQDVKAAKAERTAVQTELLSLRKHLQHETVALHELQISYETLESDFQLRAQANNAIQDVSESESTAMRDERRQLMAALTATLETLSTVSEQLTGRDLSKSPPDPDPNVDPQTDKP